MAGEGHRRVIRKRTVVRGGGGSNEATATTTTTSYTVDKDFGTGWAAWAAITVVIVSSLIGKNRLDSWQYELNQQELRNLFNATIVEGFLQDDPVLLAKVKDDKLWEACDTATLESDIRFWFYPQNEPNNLFEELVVKTYKDTPYWKEAISYEYWCNIMEYPVKEIWPWHTDRDEDVLSREKKLVFPLMGAVYYGSTHPYVGGDFHMVNAIPYEKSEDSPPMHPTDECGPDFCVSNPHLIQQELKDQSMFVKTKFDMLLYANVTHFHKTTKIKSGRRYALAMNANHWMPYKQEQAPTNQGILELAEKVRERNREKESS